jgi:hypothetical protein
MGVDDSASLSAWGHVDTFQALKNILRPECLYHWVVRPQRARSGPERILAKTKIAELEDGFKTAAIAVGTALGNLAHKVGIGTAPKAKKKAAKKAAVKKAPASKKKAAPKKKVVAKKVASQKAAPKRTSPQKAKSSAKKK